MDASQQLLADYVRNGSDTAFRELVNRYVNLVHSTALRLVNGDAHLAEDVTQTVFMDLARKAASLPADVMLGGWLHRDTCLAAGTTMRGERRRHFRERQAVAMNVPDDHTAANLAAVAPILDEAINQLEPDDRTAILLRFFEQLEFRAVGQAIGKNEDAARMRVARALEKLHTLLNNRGVTFSAAALGAVLAAEAVTAAPAGMAAAVAGAALATVNAGGATSTLLNFMTMTKIKVAVAAALAAAALAVPIAMQYQSVAKLRQENQALREQAAQMGALQADNERLSNLVAQANAGQTPAEKQTRDLARLRAEVDRLRERTNELQKQLAGVMRPGQTVFSVGGKRVFHNITMAEFARFIGEVLQAPVADQTGLTGTYDIEMTPPRIGPENEKLERVTRILQEELGLQLAPFAGPFTDEEIRYDFPSSATNGGFAIRFARSAPGLKGASGEPDTAAQPLTAGMFYDVDTPGLPASIANKLRLIDASKQQWALEFRKQSSESPTWQDIQPYLARGPGGGLDEYTNSPDGTYIVGMVASKPKFTPSASGAPKLVAEVAEESPAIRKQNACINNLRLIDASKQQWALENRKQSTDTPTVEDLRPYLGRGPNGEWPVCPDGGTYTINSVGETPTCSVAGHALP